MRLLRRPLLREPVSGIREATLFAIGVVAGLAISIGWWWWTLWSHFANPVFPYMNQFFRSPWWDPEPIFDRRFGPHTLLESLTFPLRFFASTSSSVAEVPFRDWRLALLYLFAIGALITWLARLTTSREEVVASPELRAAWRVLFAFACVSFVLWTAMHSIYRYLLPLELMSGALIVGLLRFFVAPRWLPIATTAVAALTIFTVRYPDWWHNEYSQHYFEVKVPPIADRAVVLLTIGEPMAYVLPFFPPDGRFLGANNNFNDPRRRNRLAAEIAKVVREHDGPLYSLSFPAGAGPEVLQAHQLRRVDGGCARIETNMVTSPIELCRLEHGDGARTEASQPQG